MRRFQITVLIFLVTLLGSSAGFLAWRHYHVTQINWRSGLAAPSLVKFKIADSTCRSLRVDGLVRIQLSDVRDITMHAGTVIANTTDDRLDSAYVIGDNIPYSMAEEELHGICDGLRVDAGSPDDRNSIAGILHQAILSGMRDGPYGLFDSPGFPRVTVLLVDVVPGSRAGFTVEVRW